jgi:hypothetical protein
VRQSQCGRDGVNRTACDMLWLKINFAEPTRVVILTWLELIRWFFLSRQTGKITVAQAPNLILWIAIVAGLLLWIWPAGGNLSDLLNIVFRGAILIWAADEIIRGVNPWRRCLGMAVAIYEIIIILG